MSGVLSALIVIDGKTLDTKLTCWPNREITDMEKARRWEEKTRKTLSIDIDTFQLFGYNDQLWGIWNWS